MIKGATMAVSLSEFDVMEYLDDAEGLAAYLTLVISEGDVGALAAALGSAARARGIDTGTGRACDVIESVRAGAGSLPFDAVLGLLADLRLRQVVRP